MPSILDRDGPRPIIIPPDPVPNFVLGFISLIIIIVFLFFLILKIKDSPSSGPTEIQCEPGQCSTNIFTGVKDCPVNSADIKTVNPTMEVCNSPFTCENPRTPHALQSDGSTKIGICEGKNKCRCLQKPQCAEHVTAYFETTLGNPYQGVDGQKLIISQVNSYKDLAGNFQTDSPLQFESSATEFCAISRELGERSWPPVFDENGPAECLNGILAYVPENSSTFTREDVENTALSCVVGTRCSSGEIPYWDTRLGRVNCIPKD